jgi:predicted nuclease with TOPRIM domain
VISASENVEGYRTRFGELIKAQREAINSYRDGEITLENAQEKLRGIKENRSRLTRIIQDKHSQTPFALEELRDMRSIIDI